VTFVYTIFVDHIEYTVINRMIFTDCY